MGSGSHASSFTIPTDENRRPHGRDVTHDQQEAPTQVDQAKYSYRQPTADHGHPSAPRTPHLHHGHLLVGRRLGRAHKAAGSGHRAERHSNAQPPGGSSVAAQRRHSVKGNRGSLRPTSSADTTVRESCALDAGKGFSPRKRFPPSQTTQDRRAPPRASRRLIKSEDRRLERSVLLGEEI